MCCKEIRSITAVQAWNPQANVMVTTVFGINRNDEVMAWSWDSASWQPYHA